MSSDNKPLSEPIVTQRSWINTVCLTWRCFQWQLPITSLSSKGESSTNRTICSLFRTKPSTIRFNKLYFLSTTSKFWPCLLVSTFLLSESVSYISFRLSLPRRGQTETDRSQPVVRWYRARWRFVFVAKFSRNFLFIAVQALLGYETKL